MSASRGTYGSKAEFIEALIAAIKKSDLRGLNRVFNAEYMNQFLFPEKWTRRLTQEDYKHLHTIATSSETINNDEKKILINFLEVCASERKSIGSVREQKYNDLSRIIKEAPTEKFDELMQRWVSFQSEYFILEAIEYYQRENRAITEPVNLLLNDFKLNMIRAIKERYDIHRLQANYKASFNQIKAGMTENIFSQPKDPALSADKQLITAMEVIRSAMTVSSGQSLASTKESLDNMTRRQQEARKIIKELKTREASLINIRDDISRTYPNREKEIREVDRMIGKIRENIIALGEGVKASELSAYIQQSKNILTSSSVMASLKILSDLEKNAEKNHPDTEYLAIIKETSKQMRRAILQYLLDDSMTELERITRAAELIEKTEEFKARYDHIESLQLIKMIDDIQGKYEEIIRSPYNEGEREIRSNIGRLPSTLKTYLEGYISEAEFIERNITLSQSMIDQLKNQNIAAKTIMAETEPGKQETFLDIPLMNRSGALLTEFRMLLENISEIKFHTETKLDDLFLIRETKHNIIRFVMNALNELKKILNPITSDEEQRTMDYVDATVIRLLYQYSNNEMTDGMFHEEMEKSLKNSHSLLFGISQKYQRLLHNLESLYNEDLKEAMEKLIRFKAEKPLTRESHLDKNHVIAAAYHKLHGIEDRLRTLLGTTSRKVFFDMDKSLTEKLTEGDFSQQEMHFIRCINDRLDHLEDTMALLQKIKILKKQKGLSPEKEADTDVFSKEEVAIMDNVSKYLHGSKTRVQFITFLDRIKIKISEDFFIKEKEKEKEEEWDEIEAPLKSTAIDEVRDRLKEQQVDIMKKRMETASSSLLDLREKIDALSIRSLNPVMHKAYFESFSLLEERLSYKNLLSKYHFYKQKRSREEIYPTTTDRMEKETAEEALDKHIKEIDLALDKMRDLYPQIMLLLQLEELGNKFDEIKMELVFNIYDYITDAIKRDVFVGKYNGFQTEMTRLKNDIASKSQIIDESEIHYNKIERTIKDLLTAIDNILQKAGIPDAKKLPEKLNKQQQAALTLKREMNEAILAYKKGIFHNDDTTPGDTFKQRYKDVKNAYKAALSPSIFGLYTGIDYLIDFQAVNDEIDDLPAYNDRAHYRIMSESPESRRREEELLASQCFSASSTETQESQPTPPQKNQMRRKMSNSRDKHNKATPTKESTAAVIEAAIKSHLKEIDRNIIKKSEAKKRLEPIGKKVEDNIVAIMENAILDDSSKLEKLKNINKALERTSFFMKEFLSDGKDKLLRLSDKAEKDEKSTLTETISLAFSAILEKTEEETLKKLDSFLEEQHQNMEHMEEAREKLIASFLDDANRIQKKYKDIEKLGSEIRLIQEHTADIVTHKITITENKKQINDLMLLLEENIKKYLTGKIPQDDFIKQNASYFKTITDTLDKMQEKINTSEVKSKITQATMPVITSDANLFIKNMTSLIQSRMLSEDLRHTNPSDSTEEDADNYRNKKHKVIKYAKIEMENIFKSFIDKKGSANLESTIVAYENCRVALHALYQYSQNILTETQFEKIIQDIFPTEDELQLDALVPSSFDDDESHAAIEFRKQLKYRIAQLKTLEIAASNKVSLKEELIINLKISKDIMVETRKKIEIKETDSNNEVISIINSAINKIDVNIAALTHETNTENVSTLTQLAEGMIASSSTIKSLQTLDALEKDVLEHYKGTPYEAIIMGKSARHRDEIKTHLNNNTVKGVDRIIQAAQLTGEVNKLRERYDHLESLAFIKTMNNIQKKYEELTKDLREDTLLEIKPFIEKLERNMHAYLMGDISEATFIDTHTKLSLAITQELRDQHVAERKVTIHPEKGSPKKASDNVFMNKKGEMLIAFRMLLESLHGATFHVQTKSNDPYRERKQAIITFTMEKFKECIGHYIDREDVHRMQHALTKKQPTDIESLYAANSDAMRALYHYSGNDMSDSDFLAYMKGLLEYVHPILSRLDRTYIQKLDNMKILSGELDKEIKELEKLQLGGMQRNVPVTLDPHDDKHKTKEIVKIKLNKIHEQLTELAKSSVVSLMQIHLFLSDKLMNDDFSEKEMVFVLALNDKLDHLEKAMELLYKIKILREKKYPPTKTDQMPQKLGSSEIDIVNNIKFYLDGKITPDQFITSLYRIEIEINEIFTKNNFTISSSENKSEWEYIDTHKRSPSVGKYHDFQTAVDLLEGKMKRAPEVEQVERTLQQLSDAIDKILTSAGITDINHPPVKPNNQQKAALHFAQSMNAAISEYQAGTSGETRSADTFRQKYKEIFTKALTAFKPGVVSTFTPTMFNTSSADPKLYHMLETLREKMHRDMSALPNYGDAVDRYTTTESPESKQAVDEAASADIAAAIAEAMSDTVDSSTPTSSSPPKRPSQ